MSDYARAALGVAAVLQDMRDAPHGGTPSHELPGPCRVQRRSTAGWRKPPGAVYVGRGSKWGNPWAVVKAGSRGWATWRVDCRQSGTPSTSRWLHKATREDAQELAVQLFRNHLDRNPDLVVAARRELRGHDLMCWCPLDQPCHADVLLEIANAESDDERPYQGEVTWSRSDIV